MGTTQNGFPTKCNTPQKVNSFSCLTELAPQISGKYLSPSGRVIFKVSKES